MAHFAVMISVGRQVRPCSAETYRQAHDGLQMRDGIALTGDPDHL